MNDPRRVLPPDPLDSPPWPDPPRGTASESRLELFKAQLEEIGKRRSEFVDARHESRVAIEDAQIEIIKGAVERSRDSARQIGVAASAIAVLYTGIVGAVFSIEKGQPLPLRGVMPVFLLGMAIVFATMYVTWLGPGLGVRPFPIGTEATQLRVDRVNWFNDLLSLSVLRRAWALRLATLALGAGLLFLPAAFLPVSDDAPSAPKKSAEALIPFPDPPTEGNRFAEIRYRAEVNEIAKKRAAVKEDAVAAESSGSTIREGDIRWAFSVILGLILAYTARAHWFGDLRRARRALEFKGRSAAPGGAPPAARP